MDGILSDVILEMGYDFTASVDVCRNALVHFGLQELKPSTIARMISAMIKTHSGLQENTRIYVNITKRPIASSESVFLSHLGFQWQ